MPHALSRRNFLAAASAVAITATTRAAEPADPVVIGIMGLSRGLDLAKTFGSTPGVRVKYLCDVDDARAASAVNLIAKLPNQQPQPIRDFHRMLDDKEIQAVVVATPDHWHAPATILACAAGKHVYVEKPCSHNPAEGALAVAAARKYNRVVQHGTQRRSYAKVIEAIDKVKKGEIGRVVVARGWYNNNRGGIGKGKPAPVPTGLDWNLWQGPAPRREFRDNYVPYKWHWFWHWGTGEMGNNGTHAIDLCRWGLGVDYPKKISSTGARYHFADDQESPDTNVVTYDFGDRCIIWEGRSCQPLGFEDSGFGVTFYGQDATIHIGGGGSYRIVDAKGKEISKAAAPAPDSLHTSDFLDAIRTGRRPNADIEEGHKTTLLCHLANISWRTGRNLAFDAATQQIVNDPDAMKLWSRAYEPGWEPKV